MLILGVWGGGGLAYLYWWESGVWGISFTRSGQAPKPGLAEDGWRTIAGQGSCFRCALPILITSCMKRNPCFHIRGALD